MASTTRNGSTTTSHCGSRNDSSNCDTNNRNHICLLGSSWSPCGYCKGTRARVTSDTTTPNTSPNYSVYAATSLAPSVYTRLVQKGWRRSGRVVYQPENTQACCPQHTLRLPVEQFAPSTPQRKLQRQLERLLDPPTPRKKKKQMQLSKQERYNRIHAWLRSSGTFERLQHDTLVAIRACSTAMDATTTITTHPQFKIQRYDANTSTVILKCAVLRGQGDVAQAVAQQLEHTTTVTTTGTLQVSLKVPASSMCSEDAGGSDRKLQAWWKQQRNCDKLFSTETATVVNGMDTTEPTSIPPPPLTIRTLPSEESALDPRVHQLYWDYQTKVHHDPHPLTKTNIDAPSSSSSDDDEDDDAETLHDPRAWAMVQHTYGKEPPAPIVAAVAQFWDFLVASPLVLEDCSSTATYHQQYWMGDTLIAVSVLDLLAGDGVSSVYCFYDASFPYPLGSLAILYEITHYTRDTLHWPWYYLGYYIESCPKMNYKGSFRPSQVLCRATMGWVDLDTVARPRLQAEDTCVVFAGTSCGASDDDDDNNKNGDTTTDDEDGVGVSTNNSTNHLEPSLAALRLSIHGTPCQFHQLPNDAQNELRPHMLQWIQHAGEEVAQQCVLDFRAGGGD